MLPGVRPVLPTALFQVPLEPLPQVLGKAVWPPPSPDVLGGRVSPHVFVGRVTCPLLWAAALGAAQPYGVSLTTGGYCSSESTLLPPQPCGLSCGACLLGRRPPPGLGTGSPVTGCFHGSGRRLPWSPMQPGRARTSGPWVPPLLLARWVGWVATVRPTHGLWFVVPRPSTALRARCPRPLGSCSAVCPLGVLCCVCAVLGHLAPVHQCARSVRCVSCVLSLATWFLCSGVLARCVVLRVRCPGPLGSCSPVRTLDVL